MTINIASDALLAAARAQRVMPSAALQAVRKQLAEQALATPSELRAWLAANHRLPAGQASALAGLLPTTGRDFTPYRTLAHLATGGMGAIWLAASPDQRLVVVKTLRDDQGGGSPIATDADGDLWIADASHPPAEAAAERPGSDALQRLERETRITRSLNHPHVVRCLDQGLTSDGQMFLVLEHMASGDLQELLADHGPLSELLTLSIARQVCAALAVAHRHHLLHRDVKPGNIFLAADGHAKLADFGFARSNQHNRTQLTLAGSILGSPLYMAPEQVAADTALDIRCDLYGLGCVLFHCLTGRPPYQGSMHAVLRAHCTAAVPAVADLRPGLSSATGALVTRLLQKDRADRHPDPEAVAQEVAAALRGLGHDPQQLVPLPPHTTDSSARLAICPGPDSGTDDALTSDHLLLSAAGPIDERIQLCCFARQRVVFGKLRGPTVDVCLRHYPEADHRAVGVVISRTHLALSITGPAVTIEDLGSANGTTVDGDALTARTTRSLTAGKVHRVTLARTVHLDVQPIAAAGQLAGIVIQRPDNRPDLSYAVIVGSLSLGGPGADLALPGASGRVHLGRQDNRWVQRPALDAPWQPLQAGGHLDCGGLRLTAQAGTPDDL